MKLTQNTSIKRNSGMTLIELTVVILVLLALIAVLFVGARAYKEGADTSACVMNLRNVQQAARSEANLQGIAIDGALLEGFLVDKGYFAANPLCPTDKASPYTYLAVVPAVATLYATCGSAQKAAHVPTDATKTNW
jgi:type II secretory pathway pseudopilin PulG